MKIKEKIDSYDIKSLSGIRRTIKKIDDRCAFMDKMGHGLKNNIEYAKENGYRDVNSEKAERIIDEYLQKLTKCRGELEELAESVNKFVVKMDDIWGSWS